MHLTHLQVREAVRRRATTQWRIAAGIIPLDAEQLTGIGRSAPVMAADALPVKVRESAISPASRVRMRHATQLTAPAPWGDEARLGGATT